MPLETDGQATTTQTSQGATGGSVAGGSGAAVGGSTAAPPQTTSSAGAFQAAATQAGVGQGQVQGQVQGGQTAAVGGQSAATQPPATFDALLAGHPDLQRQWQQQQAEFQQMQQWALYAKQLYAQEQQRLRQGQGGVPPAGQQQAAAQPKANLFGIPQFDRSVLGLFVRDPQSGELVPGPMAPPLAAHEYRQWSEARTNAVEGFFDDPMKYLGDPIRQMIREEAARISQGTLQQTQTTAYVNSFIQQNSEWLYERNAQGQVATDWQGKPRLSEVGQMFHDAVGAIDPQGLMPPERVQELAINVVRGQLYARQQGRQQAQPQQAAQARGNFIQQAQAAVQGGGQQPPPPAAPQAQQQPGLPGFNPMPRSRSRMMAAAEQAGLLT